MPNEEPPATIEDAFRSGVLPDALRCFIVNDLTDHLHPCPGNVIMILESPHTMEIIAGHPLAGKSGREIFTAFSADLEGDNYQEDERCSYTVGEVLYYRIFDRFPCFRRIGVVNVSKLPLQKDAYPSSVQRKFLSGVVPSFEAIRDRPRVKPDNRRKYRYFAKMISNDLHSRITKIKRFLGSDNVKFVTLGKVAKGYARHVDIEPCHDISHPAERHGNFSCDVESVVNWFRNIPTESD